jgi:hypothetical protein
MRVELLGTSCDRLSVVPVSVAAAAAVVYFVVPFTGTWQTGILVLALGKKMSESHLKIEFPDDRCVTCFVTTVK